jgi:hypothetical protein
MSDSKNKPEQPDNPAVSEELVINRQNNKLRTISRGSKGQFHKRPKTMPRTDEVTRRFRNWLLQPVANPDGTLSDRSNSILKRMFETMAKNAMMDPTQPVIDAFGKVVLDENKNVVRVVDPKIMMASAQNFKELMLRAHGMPSKNEGEIEAQQIQGVKIVVIESTANMVNREVIEEKPREKLVPNFIDADFDENK